MEVVKHSISINFQHSKDFQGYKDLQGYKDFERSQLGMQNSCLVPVLQSLEYETGSTGTMKIYGKDGTRMPEGSRKAAKGNRGTILQNWHQFSFTLIYVYGIGVLCQSFGTRVASLFRTGARGRNIPSNSKKAYQSFEAQDWQDVSILLILTSKVHVSHIFRPKTDTAEGKNGRVGE